MRKSIYFMVFLWLLGSECLHAQISLIIDEKPCVKCDILIKNWGVFTTDEVGKVYVHDIIHAKMEHVLDTILPLIQVTVAVLSSNPSLPTTIRTIPWGKLKSGYTLSISRVDVDSDAFGTRYVIGSVDGPIKMYIENSPQHFTVQGDIAQYIRYPKSTKVLRLLFWDGEHDFEIVDARSPIYRSPKNGVQTINIQPPTSYSPAYLSVYDVVLENPTIDLYDQIGLRTSYWIDEAKQYWYTVTVIDSVQEALFYATINLHQSIPPSLSLTDSPGTTTELTFVDQNKMPLEIPRIQLTVDLHYIVQQNKDLPRAVFDATITQPTQKVALWKIGMGVVVVLLVCLILYFLYIRRGDSDYV